jgi:hypothetical protein
LLTESVKPTLITEVLANNLINLLTESL